LLLSNIKKYCELNFILCTSKNIYPNNLPPNHHNTKNMSGKFVFHISGPKYGLYIQLKERIEKTFGTDITTIDVIEMFRDIERRYMETAVNPIEFRTKCLNSLNDDLNSKINNMRTNVLVIFGITDFMGSGPNDYYRLPSVDKKLFLNVQHKVIIKSYYQTTLDKIQNMNLEDHKAYWAGVTGARILIPSSDQIIAKCLKDELWHIKNNYTFSSSASEVVDIIKDQILSSRIKKTRYN
jgi:hypothetical protein